MSANTVTPEIIVSQPAQELGKTSPKQAARDENGRLLPGHTANPNGRPKTARIKDAFEGILQDEGAEKYAAVVTNIALNGARSADRLAAVTIIADRTEGKPMQSMLVGHVVDESSVRTIAELLGKLTVQPSLEESDGE